MSREATRVGAVIEGRWELERELGVGGCATVWLARDRIGQPFAIKLLHPHLRLHEPARQRFDLEVHILSQLEHPSIVRALSWSLDGERPYIVMEYKDGLRLDQEMRARHEDGAHFSGRVLGGIMRQILDALEHAHDKGIVHRDLKPINIMLSQEGAISVLDFGIARLIGESDETTVGRVVGTYRYMSPEQVKGEKADARSDLFSLGLIFFELLTLERAWPFQPAPTLGKLICEGPRPKPTDHRELDPRFDDFVARATASDPERRFQTAKELWSALEPLLELLPADQTQLLDPTPAITRPMPQPKPAHRSTGGLWAAVTVATMVGGAAIGIAVANAPEEERVVERVVVPVEREPPAVEIRPRAPIVEAPLPDPDPPAVRRPRLKKAKSEPIERPRGPTLRDLIRAAESAPDDAAKFRAASTEVRSRIEGIEDPVQSRRLKRLADLAEVGYDLPALQKIADELER